MTSPRSKHLVIGVGNEFRSDDAVGLVVARSLSKLNPDNCDILESSGEGAGLIHLWEGYDDVILIDAVKSGRKVGALHTVDVSDEEIPAEQMHFSSHSFGVAEAIEVARALGCLPARLTIYGVEVGSIEPGVDLTTDVRGAAGELVHRIMAAIDSHSRKDIHN
ncbi:MAG: hydrogenase maturation protease [candidate division Zixibacteria bacterium]|nr:hydrogenase maturation protease [candidate division Zixibacteria bacterium]